MATINLCQIPEFSKDYRNVLSFENVNNQLTFMNSKRIMQLQTNAKIDNFTTTITLNHALTTEINSCDYCYGYSSDGSKLLFFFVDNVEYLTPTTCKLYLTLDVWQTYQLELQLMPSYVDRMHVKRWDSDGYPTREVITEPLNVGEMVVTRATPRVKTNQGNYIYTTSSPIGLVTKDK